MSGPSQWSIVIRVRSNNSDLTSSVPLTLTTDWLWSFYYVEYNCFWFSERNVHKLNYLHDVWDELEHSVFSTVNESIL